MKKRTLVIALALATAATVGLAQQNGPDDRPQQNRRADFWAQARTEDGKIDLSKLPEQMPQERKDAIKAADKDGDGFLSTEEFRAFAPRRAANGVAGQPGIGGPRAAQPNGPGFGAPGAGQPGFGGPGFGQPGFGGPGFGQPGFGGPGFGRAFQDGKIDLSKLPEQTPQERKDAFKAADKDGDGFLTVEEMRELAPPQFKFEEGKKPEFLAEDGKIDVVKLTDAIKAADKNNDGFIDSDEQKAAIETAREKFGPGFFFMLMQRNPQFGAFGAFGGPFGPQFGFGGPQRDGDRPNADRPNRDRPNADRPNRDRPNADRQEGNR